MIASQPPKAEPARQTGPADIDDLLSTKLEIPLVGPRLVPRQRLKEMLRSGMERQLTLLTAPTGYGKTTLLGEWLAGIKSPDWRFLWVTVDSFDNEHMRLWRYIASAIKRVYPRLRFDPKRVYDGQVKNEHPEVLIPLINAISQIPHQILLILDDYQFITNEVIHQGINYLLAHQPRNLHIVLSSRVMPPLALCRLRAQSQLVEIQARDLCFTLPEVNRFFSTVIQVEIDQVQSAALLTTTEGWIAGLQLIGLSMRRQPDQNAFLANLPRENLQIFEYLTEEVLDQLDADLRDFLLKISILAEFSAPLCDFTLQRDDSEMMLERIQLENLFIVPLEQRRQWYSFHRLFADTLRKYLQKNISAEEQAQLHQRASAWLLRNGYPDKAISHALEIGETEQAARILDTCALQAVFGFDLGQLSQWISRFSEDLIRARPQLGIYYALANFLLERFDQVAPQLENLESLLDESARQGQVIENERLIRWEMSALRATLSYWQSPFVDIAENYKPLLVDPPAEDVYFCGLMLHSLAEVYASQGDYDASLNAYAQGCQYALDNGLTVEYCYSRSEQTFLLKALGRLVEAQAGYEDMLAYVLTHNLTDDIIAFAKAGLSEIYTEQNLMELSAEQIRWVLENFERVESSPLNWIRPEWLHVRLARYFLAVQDYASAQAFFDKALSGFRANRQVMHFLSAQLIDTQVDLWQASGELADGIEGFEEKIGFLDTLGKVRHTLDYARARYALAQKQPRQTLEILDVLIPDLARASLKEQLIAALVTRAEAHQFLQQNGPALDDLRQAVQIAAPIHYCHAFLREHQSVLALFSQLLENRDASRWQLSAHERAFIGECMDIIRQRRRTDTPAAEEEDHPVLIYPLLEPLSPREMEIVRLLSLGKRTKEIALALNVSLNTAKGHVKNIYRKIGAHTRTAFLKRVDELGILEQ
jgi:LuxR family maltose regulon positive regulatory protein